VAFSGYIIFQVPGDCPFYVNSIFCNACSAMQCSVKYYRGESSKAILRALKISAISTQLENTKIVFIDFYFKDCSKKYLGQ
jgi:hypothetical protein